MALPVSPLINRDYLIEVARGNVADSKVHRSIGSCFDVHEETPSDITDVGYLVIPRPSTVSPLSIVSTSDDDKFPAGIGCRTISICGITVVAGVWTWTIETINLNGITPVISANSFLRVNHFGAVDIGSNGQVVGRITLTRTLDGLLVGANIPGINVMRQCSFIIPDGYQGFIGDITAASTGIYPAHFAVRATVSESGVLVSNFRSQWELVAVNQGVTERFNIPIFLPPRCEVKISAMSIGGEPSRGVASMNMWLDKI